jgi:hypothetical protein
MAIIALHTTLCTNLKKGKQMLNLPVFMVTQCEEKVTKNLQTVRR